ncbi:MAG: branched-chain amino acid ABC transporter permease [Clostridia bacterium]|nr:branched-chain amino acid ABC transporter permease [Clostridia bacterium]
MKSKASLKYLVIAAVALIAGIFPWLLGDYYRSVLDFALINCIVALGLNYIYGYTGYISFAQAGFFGIGAYTAALLSVDLHVPFLPALIAAGIVAAIFGLILGIPALKLKGHYLAMATIGFGIILQLVMINWVGLTKGPAGVQGIASPSLGPLTFESYTSFYYLALVILVIAALVAYCIENSKLGRAFMAIREDELAAGACGINLTYTKVTAFMLSAFYGGIGGALYAFMLTYISPDNFSFDQSIVFFTMVLAGGAGTVWGPIIGAFALTFVPEWLRFLKEYYMAVYGVGIILLMLFLPGGIASLFQEEGRLGRLFKRQQPETVVPPEEATRAADTAARMGGL